MKQQSLIQSSARHACLYALGGVLCCTFFNATAADWASISKVKDSEMWVDMDSYNELDGLPYITTKTLFSKPQIYDKNALKLSYSESLSVTQFNCVQHTFKNNLTQFYSANKKLAGSEKGNNLFKPITANSTLADLESLVCQVQKMVGGN